MKIIFFKRTDPKIAFKNLLKISSIQSTIPGITKAKTK